MPFGPIGALLVEAMHFINGLLVPLLLLVAFLFFLWGIFQYFFLGAANEEKRQEGKKFAIWAIIGFFLMVSVWGIVAILMNTFGFRNEIRPPLPSFGGSWGGGFFDGGEIRYPASRDTHSVGSGGYCRDGGDCRSGVCTQRGLPRTVCE